MTTTPDAPALRQLEETLRAHRGDTEAYQRLGAQLLARRIALDPRYANRSLFARERCAPLGLNAKYVYDLEAQGGSGYGRQGFSAGKLIAAAEAYQVTLSSVAAVLDGRGDLEPLAAAEPSRGRLAAADGRAPGDAPPPDDGGWMPPVSRDQVGDVLAIADQIYEDLRRWTARYAAAHPGVAPEDIPDPPGGDLFGGDTPDARTWDDRADVMSVRERVRLIAGLRLRQSARGRRNSGVGLPRRVSRA